MFLGYRLKNLRKENNMSQACLGKMVGVSKVSISGYEKGIRNPSIDIFRKILDVFNISADFMMGREVNAICEDDDNLSIALSSDDIKIIREIKKRPAFYNDVVKNPKRFFMAYDEKDV